MIAAVFVDTNVFVYARDGRDAGKKRAAGEWLDKLWREQLGRTSVQVLNELYVTLTSKIHPAEPNESAWEYVLSIQKWDPQVIDADVLIAARDVEKRYTLSWWDSLIVAAAEVQGCSLLLTVDMQDGAIYGGLTVRSPFTLAVAEAAATYVVEQLAVRTHRTRGRPRRAAA